MLEFLRKVWTSDCLAGLRHWAFVFRQLHRQRSSKNSESENTYNRPMPHSKCVGRLNISFQFLPGLGCGHRCSAPGWRERSDSRSGQGQEKATWAETGWGRPTTRSENFVGNDLAVAEIPQLHVKCWLNYGQFKITLFNRIVSARNLVPRQWYCQMDPDYPPRVRRLMDGVVHVQNMFQAWKNEQFFGQIV